MASPAVVEPFEDAVGRAEDGDRFEHLQAGEDFRSETDHRGARFARHHDVDELVERRIFGLLPFLETVVEELEVLVFLGVHDGGSDGVEGLDDDFAGLDAATGAAGYLAEQLECAFATTKIGKVERDVGGNDSDQGDVGEIEALCDQLGSDQDVFFTAAEVSDYLFDRAFLLGDIAVETRDSGVGELLDDEFFDLFGADSERLNLGALALGADLRSAFLVAAMVAFELIVAAVVAEGDGARRAFPLASAVAAHEERRVGAAVEEQDRLVAGFEGLFEFFGEERAEKGRVSTAVTGAEIFDEDFGQDGRRGSVGEGEQGEFVGVAFFLVSFGLGEVLDAGGCAAEDQWAIVLLAEEPGDGSGLVAR